MKKILIIFNNDEPNFERFQNIFKLISLKLSDAAATMQFGYNPLVIQKDNNSVKMSLNGHNLSDFDYVLMYNVHSNNQTQATLIAHFLKSQNIKFSNPRELLNFNAGKILQKLLLPINNIDVPNFYFNSNLEALDYLEVSRYLGDKFIGKSNKSRLGTGVVSIETEAEFKAFISTMKEKNTQLIYFEEFIEHEQTTRGFVTNGKCDVKIKVSKEEDSFKTNHGKAIFTLDKEKDLEEICIKAAEVMGLDISGIDCVFDSKRNKYLILEVNKSPGITIDPIPSPELDAIAQMINDFIKD